MKLLHILTVAMLTLLMMGCEPATETYPVTGAPCGPDDPVHDMSAHSCTTP